jgi:glutamate dehydrogenase/leucine dehydrogenase
LIVLIGVVPFPEPTTRAIAYIKESCQRLGLTEAETNAIVDPQETRVFRLSCNVLGQTVLFYGVLALHNNARGPYKGGIRVDGSVDLYETIELARVMTLKTAAADIEFGGGKTGIKVDWPAVYKQFQQDPSNRGFAKVVARSVIESYARLYGQLFAQHVYVPAPDVGTGPDEMAIIYNETLDSASVTGKAEGIPGWLPGRRESTGYGCAQATKWAVNKILNKDISGAEVAIQGFGNVGSYTAKYLYDAGFKIVAISDIYGGIQNPNGIHIDKLMDYVAKTGSVVEFPNVDSISNEQLLSLPVDVLIPAALGHAIDVEEAKNAHARLIVEAANVPITLEGMEILKNKGTPVVPDIIVNTGGVIASMEEYSRSLTALRTKKEDILQVVEGKINYALEEAWRIAEEQKIDLCQAAVELAVSRVYKSMRNRHQI